MYGIPSDYNHHYNPVLEACSRTGKPSIGLVEPVAAWYEAFVSAEVNGIVLPQQLAPSTHTHSRKPPTWLLADSVVRGGKRRSWHGKSSYPRFLTTIYRILTTPIL